VLGMGWEVACSLGFVLAAALNACRIGRWVERVGVESARREDCTTIDGKFDVGVFIIEWLSVTGFLPEGKADVIGTSTCLPCTYSRTWVEVHLRL